MNIFTSNQVNHVYVATGAHSSDKAAGKVEVYNGNDYIYLVAHNALGEPERSDLIPIKNILWGKHTAASAMQKKLMSAKITLNNVAVDDNENAIPVEGQDYILRLAFDGYVGISPEDSQYWKYGAVHITRGMTASDFYKKMAKSIATNMAREAVQFIKVYVTHSSYTTTSGAVTKTEITKNTDLSSTTDLSSNAANVSYSSMTATGILIVEQAPDWTLGMKLRKFFKFTATPAEIEYFEGNFINSGTWGEVEYDDDGGGTLSNSKEMADLEYFHHGERGDQYRGMGFPEVINTKLLVDPTDGSGYDVYNIHYCFIGSNESSQKSEKDLTLLVPTGNASGWTTLLNTKIQAAGGPASFFS